MFKLGLLISGGGTTMQAIIKECQNGFLHGMVDPVVVIASRSCEGIAKARSLLVPVFIIGRKKFSKGEKGQQAFGKAILSLLKKAKVDIVTQNGWLPLTPKDVIKAYQKRIFNQHPGPLDYPYPDFGGKGMFGLRVHAAIINFKKSIQRQFFTEVTVQRVGLDFDQGNIVLRQSIRISKSDTPEILAQRVLPFEHQLQIKLLKLFAANTLKEYNRGERLIKTSEINRLNKAKEKAIRDYPEG